MAARARWPRAPHTALCPLPSLVARATLCLLPYLVAPTSLAAQGASADPRDARVTPPESAPLAAARPLAACLDALRPAARTARVRDDTWARHTTGLASDPRVLANLDRQPEFTLAIWDYVAVMADDERIEDGKAAVATHRTTLQQLERVYGVPASVLVAVWGVETNFGRGLGVYPIVRSLATLSCLGRRQGYFRTELFAALRILQSGQLSPADLYGSWAGAFGQVQFMPSTFERLAVDHDGDGRRDLVRDVPDALASAANFLRNAGWQRDHPWGIEVTVPASAVTRGEGRRVKRPLREWESRGLRRADGRPLVLTPLTTTTPAGLFMPAGRDGPVFLTFRNFDAIHQYNASESYALSIAHLADRVQGGASLARSWPTDDGGLSRAERRTLQQLLAARGHDIGDIDGVLGTRTVAAVRIEQARLGMPETGRPGQQLLGALRREGTR
jgi:lytic murein transglycosylase